MKRAFFSPVTLTIICLAICSVRSLPVESSDKPSSSGPLSRDNAATMARYVIHNTNWLSIATISIHDAIKGYPFVSLKSFSDGPPNNSTGIPYLYMTDMEASAKDASENNKVTVMATLAGTRYCKSKKFDPQDPRCPKVFISGNFVKVDNSTTEYSFGQEALFKKHPAMETWPQDHGFYVAKIVPEHIFVVGIFGGKNTVSLDDYLKADASNFKDKINTKKNVIADAENQDEGD